MDLLNLRAVIKKKGIFMAHIRFIYCNEMVHREKINYSTNLLILIIESSYQMISVISSLDLLMVPLNSNDIPMTISYRVYNQISYRLNHGVIAFNENSIIATRFSKIAPAYSFEHFSLRY